MPASLTFHKLFNPSIRFERLRCLAATRNLTNSMAGGIEQNRQRPSQGELTAAAIVHYDSPTPRQIDVGVNLADPAFAKEIPAVIERAKQAGLVAMVLTGTCARTTERSSSLCKQPGMPLYFTAGVHPHNAKQWSASERQKIEMLARHERCVAVGECGLDYNRNFSTPEQQRAAFIAQIQLAKSLQKPLFLHCRDAADDLHSILREHNSGPSAVKACVHCFTGSKAELLELLELDVYIGCTGWVCDDRPERGGSELAELLPLIPAKRLMIETDAPYLTPRTIKPAKQRPRRNEPALLGHVLYQVALSLGRDVHAVAEETTHTAVEFFGLPDIEKLVPDGQSNESSSLLLST